VRINRTIQGEYCLPWKQNTSSTVHSRLTLRLYLRTAAASCGPNLCTQCSTGHAEISMFGSAKSRTTWAAERGRLQYHRTATKITSAGRRYPENAEREWTVKSR
jgi:hypothetical protein